MKLENTTSKSVFSFFNIFQLTLFKYYLNILDSKEIAKDQLVKSFTLFNYFCFWLSIFPFLWFICKLPAGTSRSILFLNLPGYDTAANEVAWETLLLNSDYNEKLVNSINEIEINPNSFLINHQNFNTSIQTLLQFSTNTGKNHLTEFKPRELETKPVSFPNFDLDEIPTKLESSFPKFKSLNATTSNQSQKNFLLFNDKKEIEKSNKNLTLDLKKTGSEEKNVRISVSKEKTKLRILKSSIVSNFEKKNPLAFSTFSRSTLKNWTNYSTASEIFEKYSRSLFVHLVANENSLASAIFNETKAIRPRAMTGYFYPDLKTNDIWRLKFSQKLRQNSQNVTLSYYPQSIYFSSGNQGTYFFEKNFVPPIYDIGQTQSEGGREFFIRYDKSNNDVLIKNRIAVQTELFENFIRNNLETLQPNYFFGNVDKPGLINLVNSNFGQPADKTFSNLNNFVLKTPTFFSPADPFVLQEEFEKAYHQLSVNNLGTTIVPLTDFRTRMPELFPTTVTNQQFKSFFTNSEEKVSETFFDLAIKKLLIEHKPLIISNQLLGLTSQNFEYSSNFYKREVGSYWKTKISQTEEFLTRNEVLTTNSILSISLFGFLISSFLILKTAYADYAKEFSSYLLDLISSGKGLILDPSTIEWLNQELGLEEKKGGIRVFPKQFSKKRFPDIAGIKQLLPELSELVWFLRNRGRKFAITPLTSKSILLVGPPGTGKTLLVQALAGEAEVPVVAQSTSVLASMNQDLTPGDAIRLAFQKARSLAPCILFLDELDSLGLKRDSLLTNNSQQIIGFNTDSIQSLSFFEKTKSTETELSDNSDSDYLTNQLRISITNEFNARKQQEREQVAALTQLLIEIDGLQTNSGILVIGATNRAHILDPALTRPGRFSKIIALPLPDKNKRIEIFKLRAKHLGWNKTINWDYLAQRTKGFSAGDLATIVNQSAIQAILYDSKHTLQSFEKAITVLTTYPMEKPKEIFVTTDPYFLKREVYYKVAQSLYNYYSEVEGSAAFVELTPRQPNPRYYQILANLNNDKNRLRTRFDLEKLLTSFLSGKAGEVLMLLTENTKQAFYWESDLAKNDLYEATKLVLVMIQDWYLYTSFLQQQKFLTIPNNQNSFEYRKNEELFSLFEETVRYLDQQISNQFTFTESLNQRAHWKTSVVQEMSNIDSLFAEWSRLHLPDPQETERNPEWVPPEEYYHANETKRYDFNGNTQLLAFSELMLIERDRYIQTLLLTAFHKSFDVLDRNRELLDILALFLFKNKILRSFELMNLINKYKTNNHVNL